MLRKDGLVRAREAAQSIEQRLEDIRSVDNMMDEIKERVQIIHDELGSIKGQSENSEQAINELTKKLKDSQEEKKELQKKEQKWTDRIVQLETECKLFQNLIQQHEKDKGVLEEQLGYFQIQLEMDRSFIAHQMGVEQKAIKEAQKKAKEDPLVEYEIKLLRNLVEKVFDGMIHLHILQSLVKGDFTQPIENLKPEKVSEPLFQRALTELKSHNLIEISEEAETVTYVQPKEKSE